MTNWGNDSEAKLVNKAIAYTTRLLSSREYSRKSLTQKLALKGYSRSQSEKALEFLIANNWQCDIRFAESFIRSRVLKGQGESRINYELSQHGINSHKISELLEQQDVDWQELCNRVCEKKVNTLSAGDDLKSRIKIERFLKYRGFNGEQVRQAIAKTINCRSDSGDNDQ